MNTTIKESQNTNQLTSEKKKQIAEITRLIAQLPETEQAKIYYMLKGSAIFNVHQIDADLGTY